MPPDAADTTAVVYRRVDDRGPRVRVSRTDFDTQTSAGRRTRQTGVGPLRRGHRPLIAPDLPAAANQPSAHWLGRFSPGCRSRAVLQPHLM